jgi:phage-related protein
MATAGGAGRDGRRDFEIDLRGRDVVRRLGDTATITVVLPNVIGKRNGLGFSPRKTEAFDKTLSDMTTCHRGFHTLAMAETKKTRPVSWLKAALKDFEDFPEGARTICLAALTIAAEGSKADIAKPLLGLGSGVFEVALPFKGDAFRVVYAVQIGDDIWVVHAFQKKSSKGIKTPRHEIELVRDRLKRLKEML